MDFKAEFIHLLQKHAKENHRNNLRRLIEHQVMPVLAELNFTHNLLPDYGYCLLQGCGIKEYDKLVAFEIVRNLFPLFEIIRDSPDRFSDFFGNLNWGIRNIILSGNRLSFNCQNIPSNCDYDMKVSWGSISNVFKIFKDKECIFSIEYAIINVADYNDSIIMYANILDINTAIFTLSNIKEVINQQTTMISED